ncbi:MAG: hypothetical protein QM652_11955 [Legionella sp.]|uniref:hypothetical protein n=1 Tax=Legionella sp. TaxID=459 RepID=UPI0039E5EFC5
MKSQLSLLNLAIALLGTSLSHANSSENLIEKNYFPRITGQILAGSDQQLGGFGDGMLPILQTHDRIFFADGTVMLGQEQRTVLSGGLGYRDMRQTSLGEGIIGAYLFTDFYHSGLKNEFWQLNPGVEWLTGSYEVRLQGYIPVSKHAQTYSYTLASALPVSVLTDTSKKNNLAGVTGHSFFDTPVALMEEAGPGVELEAGRFFDYAKGFWVRVGGYHFDYSRAKNINGVEANIEAIVKDHVSLLLQNNYDNQNKNRFAVGVRVNFGGSSAPIPSLENRMISPIIRHLARQSYGKAIPTRTVFKAIGPRHVLNNIWFFSPAGVYPAGAATTLSNCTAENPCSTIDSATAEEIAALAPNANLYFASGTYLIPPNTLNLNNWVNLQNGQSIFGRNTGWLTAASGNNRPLVNGALIWGSQSVLADGALYDMRVNSTNQLVPSDIMPTGFNDSVIGIGFTGDMQIINSEIQALNINNDNVSVIAVNTLSGDTLIDNSHVIAINNGNAMETNSSTYTMALNVNDLTISNSTISAESTGSAIGSGSENSVYAIGALNVIATNITANTTLTGDNKGGNSQIIGISANEMLNLSNSIINITSNGDVSGGNFRTLWGTFSNSMSTIDRVIINVQANNNSNGINSIVQTIGVQSREGSIVNNSTINVEADGVATNSGQIVVYGLRDNSNNAVIFEGNAASYITAIASQGTSLAPIMSSGPILNNSIPKSQCSTDGVHFIDC